MSNKNNNFIIDQNHAVIDDQLHFRSGSSRVIFETIIPRGQPDAPALSDEDRVHELSALEEQFAAQLEAALNRGIPEKHHNQFIGHPHCRRPPR